MERLKSLSVVFEIVHDSEAAVKLNFISFNKTTESKCKLHKVMCHCSI